MAEKKLKDWFDKELAELLSTKIAEKFPSFDKKSFISDVEQGVQDLQLKARLSVFSNNLKTYLPSNYGDAISILISILGEENQKETGMFTEYYWVMPIAKFVEEHGLENFDESIKAIAEITKRNTGEYAIRQYLKAYPDQTLKIMTQWSLDKNFHLRRLASEGSRSRLPWASKLDMFIDDPQLLLPILDNLKDDPIKFVQKSVANSLNDILKDNYEFAMSILQEWAVNASKERSWIIKHALRKQVKDGNPEAIELRKLVI